MNGIKARTYWTPVGRALVFLLATSSIACLLLDFYRVCPMRWFAPWVLLPAMVVLAGWGLVDWRYGDGRLWRAVVMGSAAGFGAALTYDVFRLPFVFAKEWGIAAVIPPMDLFKVFPGFGAMILGQSIEQTSYSHRAQILGWIYHFSNGTSFGVMYLAMIGEGTRRHWLWAVVMAVGLELGMLLTPYPQVFKIAVTPRFVVVTMAAHAIFGVGLGLGVRSLARRWAVARPGGSLSAADYSSTC